MNKSGLTLVEIIITVAILGIVALLFVNIFANGHGFVMDAGRDSQDLIADQESLESKLTAAGSGFYKKIDMNELYPTLYIIPDQDFVEGVEYNDGNFTTFLSGIIEYDIAMTNFYFDEVGVVDLLIIGEEYNLVPTYVPDDATYQETTWVSSSPSLVSVDAYGKVTAVGITGTSVRITATTDEGRQTAFVDFIVTGASTNNDASLVTLQFYYPSDPGTIYDVTGFVPGAIPNQLDQKNYSLYNIGNEAPDLIATASSGLSSVSIDDALNTTGNNIGEVTVIADDGTTAYYRVEFNRGAE
jgi:prepilin-type N-terminal cleavage/methylation domain-containing protein